MKKKLLRKILIVIFTLLFITMIMPKSFAGITPDQIKGNDDGTLMELDFLDDIADGIRYIGTFIAVGALMIIGIKYMTGSIEEKANYKKSMMPYIIGCVILFGASAIAPQIKELVGTEVDSTSIGNQVLGIIRAVGSMFAIGVLMVLGIKYMLGSVEERASYKKSMLPYVAGMILLFASVNIASAINDMVQDTMPVENVIEDDYQYDFSERKCSRCGSNVEPIFDIDKHTYVCPKCGNRMD